MEKSKKTIIQFLICIGLLCVIWGGYYFCERQIRVSNEKKAILGLEVTLDYNVIAEVEDVILKEDLLTISGWAIQLDSVNDAIDVILQPVGTTTGELLTTESVERKEITDYYVPNQNVGMCGFVSKVRKDKLDQDVCYEILLSVERKNPDEEEIERKKITTNQYLYNAEVYRYNPKEFVEPQIDDAEVHKVIEKGDVRLYSKDNKVWIYQYGTELYFISDAGYETANGNEIVHPVMVYTSRQELLPDSEITYEHLGFYEEKKECDEKYRVGVVTLPTQYPITYINTGLYDFTEKKWIQSFCIDVDYENLY